MTPRTVRYLAADFHAWEVQGRGWYVSPSGVDLEPVFSEILRTTPVTSPIDDGRVPSSWQRAFSKRVSGSAPISASSEAPASLASVPANREEPATKIVTHRILIPAELKITQEQSEQLFVSLAAVAPWISLEIVGTNEGIVFQIACPEDRSAAVVSQLRSQAPAVTCRLSEDTVYSSFRGRADENLIVVDVGLRSEWFLPLTRQKGNSTDPLIPLIAVMDGLSGSEFLCLQVRFCRARGAWQRTVQKTLFDRSGKLVFSNFQDQLAGIKEKLFGTLLAATVRFAIAAGSRARSLELAKMVQAYFVQFACPHGNEFIPLRNANAFADEQTGSFLARTTHRTGFLITVRELEAVIHLPSNAIHSEKLARCENASKVAPDTATTGELVLGINEHNDRVKEIRLSTDKRIKHTHLIGASGSGKSTLLTTMMAQDLTLGNGFACLDPHGDLIDAVLERVPDSRLRDVVIFDPADEQFPVALNILSAHSELERTLLASDLVGIFRRFATSWGDQMNSVLANAVLAFLQSNRGGSLLDLRKFLLDKNFRQEFLQTVNDDEIRYYWEREFPELRGKPYAPLLTRLDTFLRSRLIRHIVAQRDNKLDFRAFMDERKILLVKLSLGAIGEENAYLLGSLLVAKIYMAALSRQEITEEERKPFYLYLDEAHHFLTPSMNQILSGVRKYKIGLTLAHQQLAQFHNADADILASVLSNCYTRVCFRVDDADAERLAKGFSFFTSDHLKNLGVGQAIARFEQSQFSFNLRTFPTDPVSPEVSSERRRTVIERSRKLYAKSRIEVEDELRDERPAPYESSIKRAEAHPASTASAEDPKTTDNGRGGRHHDELQQVIRRMAVNLGFEVEIEKQVLDGAGRVDVSLEKDNLRVACEVSVTTADYEIHNAEKCLAAGYDHVFVVVSNRKKLPLIKRKLHAELPASLELKVKVCTLMDLLGALHQLNGSIEQSPGKRERSSGDRLNFTEACELLGKAPSTVYRWINEGRIPFYRVGREYQFDRDELLLLGKQDLSRKRSVVVDVEPLKVEKRTPKNKKEQDARYRKLLKLD